MKNWTRLSTTGSDRATAYNMSSKIVRRDDRLFVGWLDAPLGPGLPARIQLGVCDAVTGALEKTLQLGEGIDNHCGPALALDGHGRLHAVTGAHHGPFLYRWSDRPSIASSWSEPEPLGPADTYPSLVVDSEGTLHLAYREKGERWQLWYRRRRAGGTWEPPQALAVSPTIGYNHFMQSITVGPDGTTLHLTFQFHYAQTGRAIDCKGRAAVYLCSGDGGTTWFNEEARCDPLPLTIETVRSICHHPEGDVRIGNHVVDAQNRPWLYSALPGSAGGALWHRTDGIWVRQDTRSAFQSLNMRGPRSTALSRAVDGQLHLAFATDPGGRETAWFDPRHELFHLVLDESGAPLALAQLSASDPGAANWIPAVEHWDWTRPDVCGIDHLWVMYTHGRNAGGIGGDNRNAVQTEVILGRLPVGV